MRVRLAACAPGWRNTITGDNDMNTSSIRRCATLLTLASCLAFGNAQASIIVYSASLNGANESPPNASTGTGSAVITFDTVASTMNVHIVFAGLVAGDTASHIHCCTAAPNTGTVGVATTVPTFTGFPGGVVAGTYDHLFDMSLAASWNAAYITSHGGTTQTAFASLLAGAALGEAYLNIHTENVPGGEIRGFLTVPEPMTLALLGLALVGIAAMRRKRSA
jgi:hypothetical protein